MESQNDIANPVKAYIPIVPASQPPATTINNITTPNTIDPKPTRHARVITPHRLIIRDIIRDTVCVITAVYIRYVSLRCSVSTAARVTLVNLGDRSCLLYLYMPSHNGLLSVRTFLMFCVCVCKKISLHEL